MGGKAMFEGFNESTVKYYQLIKNCNSKDIHKENEALYFTGIKYPLEALYYELYDYFRKLDSDLLSSKRRCISTAYNDARFCRESPIKEYFYVKFKLDIMNKKNALGFFFDASLTGYKFGLNIYNLDARGMEKIRNYLLNNKQYAKKVIDKFNRSGLLKVRGEKYKRKCYAEENAVLQEWLEHKQLFFVQESELGSNFYSRDILDDILAVFDNTQEVYFMLKEALQTSNI